MVGNFLCSISFSILFSIFCGIVNCLQPVFVNKPVVQSLKLVKVFSKFVGIKLLIFAAFCNKQPVFIFEPFEQFAKSFGILLIIFNVFFTPILADVPSTEEIYNDLFTEEEEIPTMACAVAMPSKRDNFTALVKAEQARNTYKHVTEDN